MNRYLFIVDTNGFLYYYPDSIAITPLTTWIENMSKRNNLSSILDGRITLDKYLILNKYVFMESHLDSNAYGLCDMFGSLPQPLEQPISKQYLEPVPNKPTPDNNYPAICNTTQAECNQANYSSLGYILSWLNPLAYYNTSSIQTANPITEIPVPTATATAIAAAIPQSTSSSTSATIEDITYKVVPEVGNDTSKSAYYLDTNSLASIASSNMDMGMAMNMDLVKIQNNQVKILKPQRIDIPAFITDIAIDNVDNIIISGRIDNQPLVLKYNKYLIGMHLA
jgi:hypothetical protein